MKYKCHQAACLEDAFDVANEFTRKHVAVKIYEEVWTPEPDKPVYLVCPEGEETSFVDPSYTHTLVYEADDSGCTFYPTASFPVR